MHKNENSFRGWRRPGPKPPGGVDAGEGETLDYLCGYYKIFQYEKGHRYSTDDVLTAWYGTTCAPRVDRAADLGSGIGSVAISALPIREKTCVTSGTRLGISLSVLRCSSML